MNGVHDMGGMHGMGPINPEANEPVFHAAWEGRAFALNVAARKFLANASARRYAIEKLAPADYLRMSYYQRWFVRMVNMLLESGAVPKTRREGARLAVEVPRIRLHEVVAVDLT